MIGKFTALAANSFMKILFRNFEKEKGHFLILSPGALVDVASVVLRLHARLGEHLAQGVAGHAELLADRPDGDDRHVHALGDDRVGKTAEKGADLVLPVADLLERVLDSDLLERSPDAAVVHDRRAVDRWVFPRKLLGLKHLLSVQLCQSLAVAVERELDLRPVAEAHQHGLEAVTAGGTAGGEVIGVLIEPANDLHGGQVPRARRAGRPRLVPLTAKLLNESHAESEDVPLNLNPLRLGEPQRLRQTLGLANPLTERHMHLHILVLLKELGYHDPSRDRDYQNTMIPIMLKLIILRRKSQEAASVASWECLKNFSFMLLTESGISFCPENSVRFGSRAARFAPRGIDFSYVVRPVGIEPTTISLRGSCSTN